MNMRDVHAAAEILAAAQSGLNVGRLIDGNVFRGVARSIGTDRGTFGDPNADIRELYLRVTDTVGDHYWPIAYLIGEYHEGTFCVTR